MIISSCSVSISSICCISNPFWICAVLNSSSVATIFLSSSSLHSRGLDSFNLSTSLVAAKYSSFLDSYSLCPSAVAFSSMPARSCKCRARSSYTGSSASASRTQESLMHPSMPSSYFFTSSAKSFSLFLASKAFKLTVASSLLHCSIFLSFASLSASKRAMVSLTLPAWSFNCSYFVNSVAVFVSFSIRSAEYPIF